METHEGRRSYACPRLIFAAIAIDYLSIYCYGAGASNRIFFRMNPRITVVIPAFNEERFIGACLASLQRQDYAGDHDVIVVDNNCTDRTAAIARSFGATVITETTPGVCHARQAGTENATGDIIVSTDADTVFPTDWLSRIAASFEQHPDAVAIGGSCEYRDAPKWASLYATMLFGTNAFIFKKTGRVGYLSACNTAFRRDTWPGYNTALTQGGDEIDFLARLKKNGPVAFERTTTVLTSGRRLRKGFLYNVVVTIFLHYLVEYVFGRLTGKRLFGSFEPIRQEYYPMSTRAKLAELIVAVIVVVGTSTFVVSHNAFAARTAHATGARLDAMSDTVAQIPAVHTTTVRIADTTNKVMNVPAIRTAREHVSQITGRIHLPRHHKQKPSEA